MKADTFANVTACTSACLTSVGDDNLVHVSLQIPTGHVMVQYPFTHVCQGVPNKMLGAHYNNRDVSSF